MPRTASPLTAILARVQRLADDTRGTLKRELARIEEEKEMLTAGLERAADRVRAMLGEFGGNGNGRNAKGGPKQREGKRGKRIRRNPQELKREADAIFQLVKSKGDEGAVGREIRKQHPKVGPNIKGFVLKHGGHKLKTSGKKASTRYLAG